MCLTDKAKSGALWVVDNFVTNEPKTKLFASFLKALPAKQKSFLVLTAGKDESMLRMTKNIQRVTTRRAEDVNVMDLLNKQAVIVSADGAKKMEELLKK